MGLERRGWVIATDLGQLVRWEEPFVRWKAAAFTRWHERMMREYQVRICERLGVKFPGLSVERAAGLPPITVEVVALQRLSALCQKPTFVKSD
jgi:hypothetical protein